VPARRSHSTVAQASTRSPSEVNNRGDLKCQINNQSAGLPPSVRAPNQVEWRRHAFTVVVQGDCAALNFNGYDVTGVWGIIYSVVHLLSKHMRQDENA
jgi:hypothetical protein